MLELIKGLIPLPTKNVIITIIITIILFFNFIYIRNLKNEIFIKDNNITELTKQIGSIQTEYLMNRDTLEATIKQQNDSIDKLKLDNDNYIKLYNQTTDKLNKEYNKKIEQSSSYSTMTDDNLTSCQNKLKTLESVINEELQ